MVMVRMLTALSALCLWKGSMCSSKRSTGKVWDSRLVCCRSCDCKRRHGGPFTGRSCLSSNFTNYFVSMSHAMKVLDMAYRLTHFITAHKCLVFLFHI
jgi:hypothetical protein